MSVGNSRFVETGSIILITSRKQRIGLPDCLC